MIEYSATLGIRSPSASGWPYIADIAPFQFSDLMWSTEVNQPGAHSVTGFVADIASNVRESLRDLIRSPLELKIVRDGEVKAIGPVTGWAIRGGRITVRAAGLLQYLAYMRHQGGDVSTTGDPFVTLSGLIDDYQALSYGHFGLDTSTIGTSSLSSEIVVKGLERPTLLSVVRKAGVGMFDVWVDPETRGVHLYAPQKGGDATDRVMIDVRNLDQVALSMDVAPDAIGSDVDVVVTNDQDFQTAANQAAVYETTAGDDSVRAGWGRVHVVRQERNLTTTQADAVAEALVPVFGATMLGVDPDLFPVADATVDDFNEGDTIEYGFDAGLGHQTVQRRVKGMMVRVDGASERLGVSFF